MGENQTVDFITKALVELTGTNSVQLFIGLIEMMNDGVMVVDNKEQVIFVNSRFSAITGYPKEELIGKVAAEVLLAKKAKIEMDEKVEDRSSGISKSYDVQIVLKNGDIGWLRISGSPIYDVDGKIVGSIGIHGDITKEKKQELSLKIALEKEKALNLLKSQFVSTASHQFRTPLAIIQSNVELMCMKIVKDLPNKKGKYNVYNERIRTEITNMTDLMDQVLMIDKINTGKLESKLVGTNLVQICKEIIKKVDQIAGQRCIELNVFGHPRIVLTDVQLFEHAVLNLLSNALKYSSEKNPVFNLLFQDEDVQIEIIDDGIGIPKNEQKLLFQPFFRASNTFDIQGTGLGLRIVKDFTEKMGGQINIESKENMGTKVKLILPN